MVVVVVVAGVDAPSGRKRSFRIKFFFIFLKEILIATGFRAGGLRQHSSGDQHRFSVRQHGQHRKDRGPLRPSSPQA